MAQDTALKRTPLYETHLRAGARMVPFGGWEMPVQYSGIIEEHQAVRQAAGLFDVSHMGEFHITGPGAQAFVQRVVANDDAALARSAFAPVTTTSGPSSASSSSPPAAPAIAAPPSPSAATAATPAMVFLKCCITSPLGVWRNRRPAA